MRRQYKLMWFGLGGNGAEIIEPSHRDGEMRTCHSSWYLKPEGLQQCIDNGHYPAEEMEGCILIDKTAVLEENPGLAFSSPMCNALQQDGEPDRFIDVDVDPLMAGVIAQNFGMIGLCAAKAKVDPEFSGLDTVSPQDYTDWWRKQGARIGRVTNGQVVWES